MDDNDPFSGVAVFVVAARAETFTRAEDKLGLTKSAVGEAITRLKDRIGFKLFHRTTRLTRLTFDGEAYLADCISAIDDVTSAQTPLSSQRKVLSGRLHIDMPVAFGRRSAASAHGDPEIASRHQFHHDVHRRHQRLAPRRRRHRHAISRLLVEVLSDYADSGVEVHAVWPQRGQLSPRVRYRGRSVGVGHGTGTPRLIDRQPNRGT